MDNSCESPPSLQLAMKNSRIYRKVLRLPSYEEVGQNSPSFATPGSPKVSKRMSRDSMDFLKNPMMFCSDENIEASDSTKRRRSRVCVLNRRLTICILVLVCLVIIGIVIAIVSAEIFHPRGYFHSEKVGGSILAPQQESVSEQQDIGVEDAVATTTFLPPSDSPGTVERTSTFLPAILSNPLLSNGGPQANLQNALSFQGPLQLFGR